MILLLVFSTVLSTFALREILLGRVDTRSERGIVQEVTEFRGFAGDARDPRTGELLGDRLGPIFDAFLARDIPDSGEATFTFLDGRPYRSNADVTTSRELLNAVRSLGAVQTVKRGEVSSPEGRVRYLAVPVRSGGRVRGAFVVTSAVGQEAAEVTEAIQVAAEGSPGPFVVVRAEQVRITAGQCDRVERGDHVVGPGAVPPGWVIRRVRRDHLGHRMR